MIAWNRRMQLKVFDALQNLERQLNFDWRNFAKAPQIFELISYVCTRRMRNVWRPFKVKRRKRTAEQHKLNTGNALYNTLPAHMCRPDSARVCVCVRRVCVCVCRCVWRVCGMAANVKNQTTASPAKPTANQNVQPAAKSTAVGGSGCGRATWGGMWHKGATQCARARKWKGKEGTEAKRPQQNGRAVGQLASRKTAVGGRGGTTKGLRVSQCQKYTYTCTHAHTHTYTCTCTNLHVRYMQKWNK